MGILTGKLAFICFGPTMGKFYSPILSTGGSINQSLEEKRRTAVQALKEHKRRKQPMSMLLVIREGSHHKIEYKFLLMAQNEDSAAQAHQGMHFVTMMKRAELTQKMIEMKMSTWEKMGSGVVEDIFLNQ
jgi:hypothetical protein